MSQAAEGGASKGFNGKDSGIPSFANLEASTLAGLKDIMAAPAKAAEFKRAFETAKGTNSREQVAEIKKAISRFLDKTTQTQIGIEQMLTAMNEGDENKATLTQMLEIFNASVDELFNLEEEVGTWLEQH